MCIITFLAVKVQETTSIFKTTSISKTTVRVSQKKEKLDTGYLSMFVFCRREILETRTEARIFLCVPGCKKTTIVVWHHYRHWSPVHTFELDFSSGAVMWKMIMTIVTKWSFREQGCYPNFFHVFKFILIPQSFSCNTTLFLPWFL